MSINSLCLILKCLPLSTMDLLYRVEFAESIITEKKLGYR